MMSNPDLVKASSFEYISATRFTPKRFFTAATVTGMTSASGIAVRKIHSPMSVMPSAVVEVPITGICRSTAAGPAANISFDSVGPNTATTWSRARSSFMALSAWSF